MNKILSFCLIMMITASLHAQERVRGRLDSVHLTDNRIVVNGVEYRANTELTRVLYKGLDVGEEGLSKGDQVELVFEQASGSEPMRLVAILLLRGSRAGLDS